MKRFPGTSKWTLIYERNNVKGINVRSIKGDFDRFEKDRGKWVARLRDNNPSGYIDKPLKMFDLIRIGKTINSRGEPTDFHYVVWLGGDNSWVIDSANRTVLTIKQYKKVMGGNIVVKKIVRSNTIADD